MIQIDIEMPKTCGQCFCAMEDYDYNTVRCRFKYDLCFDANSRDYSNRRLDGCPLHEVTESDTISRPQWIPCSERLPDEHKYVLCCTYGGTHFIGHIKEAKQGEYMAVSGDSDYKTVYEIVAWMPLQEPYQAQEKSQEVSNNSPELDKENGELISRQSAIDAVEFGITYAKAINKSTGEVKELFKEGNKALNEAVERIKDLPSAQPEKRTDKCTETHACDSISRQDAIEHLKKRLYESALNNDGIASYTFEEIADNRIQIWMDELPPSPSIPQWIPCEDRLPRQEQRVLINLSDGDTSVGWLLRGNIWFTDYSYGKPEDEVVAWMPLPEPYHRP